MVGPARPQFVLFGSSIVEFSYSDQGWGAILANLYARKADIILRGYAGWNSRRALQNLDKIFPKDATDQTSLVIVYFGGNDSMHPHPSGLSPHVPLQEYIENMRKIVIHLKLCREMNVKAIDLWSALQQRHDWLDVCFTDGIHLSNEGSKIVAKEILKVLGEADWEPSLHWNSMPIEFAEDSLYEPISADENTPIDVSN
ncbi:GDSL esterase/lipase CPRD49 [Glycine max]|nr:GDSL esterase/lipase CPRD49 [Glycine max]